MDEEPDQGPGQENQAHYPERSVVPAPSTGDDRVDAAVAGLITGDDRVDAAVAGLSRLPGQPVADHVAILEEVHGRLRDILGELAEDQPGQEATEPTKGRP